VRIGFVTLFPEMVMPALGHSIMSRAAASGAVSFDCSNPRDFATDAHRSVDDSSYGGGPGMVMMPHLIQQSLASLGLSEGAEVILMDPAGERFTQGVARELAGKKEVVFVCGHYEGVDERVRETLCTRALTIGDFVLTGGELPALTMTDAIVRLLPGVLGDPQSHMDDSHSDGLLGFPLYTRPGSFEGREVPEVLMSGHHGKIAAWRRREQLMRTRRSRPDLFAEAELTKDDVKLLGESGDKT
jgi:tRNA (guanine37-N1)-methyltransferase